MRDYTPPAASVSESVTSFNCPRCGTYSAQDWWRVRTAVRMATQTASQAGDWIKVSQCHACGEWATWAYDTLVYPDLVAAPLPNSDMPDDVRVTFEEARQVVGKSPRAGAALLRLSVQQLLPHLGQPGKNINEEIGNLVQQGLPAGVQHALDVVRVVGNNAVHPGTIDLDDDPAIANSLFKLVNLIVEKMISEPRELQELHDALPQGALDAIARRDDQ